MLKNALRAARWDVGAGGSVGPRGGEARPSPRSHGASTSCSTSGRTWASSGASCGPAGYAGRIVSFEPLREAHAALASVAARDGNWVAERLALGSSPGTATIHVTANLASSSFLEPTPRLERTAPYAAVTGRRRFR